VSEVSGDTRSVNAELLDRLRERARAGITAAGAPRTVVTSHDVYGLVRALAPLLPADGAVEVWDTGPGRVFPDGSGHILDQFPYGGSVIDGYDLRLTVVLANGAVVVVEQHDLWPSAGPALVYGDVPDAYFDSPAR
jgi:hypothetical protein